MKIQGKWAIIGSASEPFAIKTAKNINREGPYEARIQNGNVEFGLKNANENQNHFIQTTKYYRRTNYKELGEKLLGISRELRDFPGFQLTEEQIQNLKNKALSRESYKGFEALRRLVFYSHLSGLGKTFNSVIAPIFFQKYPKGRILFGYATRNINIALATLRVMGAGLDLFEKDYTSIKTFGSLKMLTNVQTSGVFFPGKYFSIPLAMFVPALYGFTASQAVASFVFLLDNKISEIREYYPVDGLDFFRLEASGLFSQSKSVFLPDFDPSQLDTLALLGEGFELGDIADFLRQFVAKLDRCLSFLFNPANFVSQESRFWIGLRHYQSYLSFDRLADEVLLMVTDNKSYLRKLALFRILDQISSLSARNQTDEVAIFKNLLFPGNSKDIVKLGLQEYKGKIAIYFLEKIDQLRKEMIKTVMDGMYLKERYNKQTRKVRVSDSLALSEEDYVVNTIREMRNTYHGYKTRDFQKYLAINTGGLPDSLPLLGVLAYFALVAKPNLFISTIW